VSGSLYGRAYHKGEREKFIINKKLEAEGFSKGENLQGRGSEKEKERCQLFPRPSNLISSKNERGGQGIARKETNNWKLNKKKGGFRSGKGRSEQKLPPE